MTTLLIGIVLGLAIGFACRWFDIPLPSPPNIVGALLVVAMTLGFITADYVMTNQKPVATKAAHND
jgi:XapX domain-containing protein